MPMNRVGCSMARPSPVPEAPRQPIRRDPRSLHMTRRVTPSASRPGRRGRRGPGRWCNHRLAGSKGYALGGSRAEPWPYFLLPGGSPGQETDMRSDTNPHKQGLSWGRRPVDSASLVRFVTPNGIRTRGQGDGIANEGDAGQPYGAGAAAYRIGYEGRRPGPQGAGDFVGDGRMVAGGGGGVRVRRPADVARLG